MEGIPPARATDNEEVRWALETAESLWKRSALVDAIVWLRRAAQEAAQSGDADRAAGLMLEAATLTEAMARASAQARAALPASVPPPANEGDIDALLAENPSEFELEDVDVEEIDSADPSSQVPTPVVHVGHAIRDAAVPSDRPGITRMGEGALSAMDLAGVGALAGLPHDARERLIRDASVILCTADVLLPDFAFALILEGEVAARSEEGHLVARFGHGGILRTRGTLAVPLPAAFTATLDGTTMALWSEESLARVLETTPAVDVALRSAGDGLQAWTYVAASAMGARLHEDVRLRLVTRLTARALRPGAPLVRAGEAVPGILLVGVGKITIDEPVAHVIGPGKFVFAGETLSAARATATARAGDDGAVVLSADRRTTQELCVTEPLLLELLALDC